eukprot:Transcript_26144.p1 GENE.Transcript_26144~~Transcript_26144.p1  ORF type:complete len:525 (-),score=253.67 Transcript_26144:913-2487(-)
MGCAGSKPADPSGVKLELGDDMDSSKHGLDHYNSSVEDRGSAVTAGLVKQHIDDGVTVESKYDLSGSRELGKGAYGVVRTCKRKGTQDVFALKTITVGLMDPDEVRALQSEVDILRSLDHPSVVRLFETFLDRKEQQLHVIMEMLAGGNLRDRLMKRNPEPYPEPLAAKYMRSMHSAILYCHNHSVCHRDIKLENFTFESLGDEAQLKLIDFGLSAVVNKGKEKMAQQVGTVPFMAPEQLTSKNTQYNSACDMWSLGVAMYELLAGFLKRPYSTGPCTRSYSSQLKHINKQGPAKMPAGASADAQDLLKQLLAIKPGERLSAADAMQHPWLQQAAPARASVERQGSMKERQQRASLSIAGFAQLSPLQRLAFDAMAFSITPKRLEELRRTFNEADVDGSGTLSLDELKKLMGAEMDAEGALAALDTMNTQEVTYTEFLAAMVSGQDRFKDDSYIKAAFDELDSDGSGEIDLEEVAQILGHKGADMVKDLKGWDTDGSGSIGFDEFKKLMEAAAGSAAAPAATGK